MKGGLCKGILISKNGIDYWLRSCIICKIDKYLNLVFAASFLILLFVFGTTVANASKGFVKVNPTEVNANLSAKFTVTVNGIPIPVIKVKGSIAPSYVQFSFTGAVDVVIHVNEAVSSYTLTPKSYNITSTNSGSDISFTLDKPRHLILHHVNSSTESLGIFAESIEENVPIPGGSVLNVMNYGVDNTGATNNSTQIQNALNAVASGGTLYFPAGKYTANLLKPKANTTVYLAAGAVLQAISTSSSVSSMFYIGNSGVSIRGRGVIDGRGDIHFTGSISNRGTIVLLVIINDAKVVERLGIVWIDSESRPQ